MNEQKSVLVSKGMWGGVIGAAFVLVEKYLESMSVDVNALVARAESEPVAVVIGDAVQAAQGGPPWVLWAALGGIALGLIGRWLAQHKLTVKPLVPLLLAPALLLLPGCQTDKASLVDTPKSALHGTPTVSAHTMDVDGNLTALSPQGTPLVWATIDNEGADLMNGSFATSQMGVAWDTETNKPHLILQFPDDMDAEDLVVTIDGNEVVSAGQLSVSKSDPTLAQAELARVVQQTLAVAVPAIQQTIREEWDTIADVLEATGLPDIAAAIREALSKL